MKCVLTLSCNNDLQITPDKYRGQPMKFRRKSIVFSLAVLHLLSILVNYTVMFSMNAGLIGFLCSGLLTLSWIYAVSSLRTRKQKRFCFIYWSTAAVFCLFLIFSGNKMINAENLILAPFWTIFYTPFSGISYLLSSRNALWFIHGFTLFMFLVFAVRRRS